jgi:hypothetical protein
MTSGLPPTSDLLGVGRQVADVPSTDIGPLLLNHIVGASKQRWWNGQFERLRRLEVDCRPMLCRCLCWQFGRLLAFEDAVYIACGRKYGSIVSGPYEIRPPSLTR